MADQTTSRLWYFRWLFLFLALTLLFFRLLPLQTEPRSLAGPDVMMALIFNWSMRRPSAVPSTLIAIIVLIEDMFLMRPPGLQAALIVLAAAWLKLTSSHHPDRTFIREWLSVAAAIVFVTVTTRFAMLVFFVPLPPFTLHFSEMFATILFFPIVAGITHYIFGLKPVGSTDSDARATRGRL